MFGKNIPKMPAGSQITEGYLEKLRNAVSRQDNRMPGGGRAGMRTDSFSTDDPIHQRDTVFVQMLYDAMPFNSAESNNTQKVLQGLDNAAMCQWDDQLANWVYVGAETLTVTPSTLPLKAGDLLWVRYDPMCDRWQPLKERETEMVRASSSTSQNITTANNSTVVAYPGFVETINYDGMSFADGIACWLLNPASPGSAPPTTPLQGRIVGHAQGLPIFAVNPGGGAGGGSISNSTITYNNDTFNVTNSTVTYNNTDTLVFAGVNIDITSLTTIDVNAGLVYQMTTGGYVVFNVPVEFCGYSFACCTTYTFLAATVNDWALPAVGTPDRGAVVYDLTAFAGGTTITSIVPPQIGGATGPSFIVLRNVGTDTITIDDQSAGGGTAANRVNMPPAYAVGVTLKQWDAIGLWYDVCSSTKWGVYFCTVDIDSGGGTPVAARTNRAVMSIPNSTITTFNFSSGISTDSYDTNGTILGNTGLTVPTTGYYHFGAWYTNNGAATVDMTATIKNSTAGNPIAAFAIGGGMTDGSLSGDYHCTAGDVIILQLFQGSGGPVNADAAMWMHQIH